MAITLSSATTAVDDTGLITSSTVTKTVSSQSSNTFVFVAISCHKQGSFLYEDPSSVTYDGEAMTKLDSISNTQGGVGVWYIQNAEVGTGEIEATWSNNMIWTRLTAIVATGCHATSAIANSDSTTMTTQTDDTTSTLTATSTWTGSKIMGFDMSYVNNRTYDMDIGGTETSLFTYSLTNYPNTGYVIKHQSSYKTSTGGSISLTRTMDNISDTGNDVYLSFLAFELRASDGAIVLDLDSNMKMTSLSSIRIDRTFLSNIALATIFTKTKTFTKVFLENVKLTTAFLTNTLKTFTSNLVMTSSIGKLVGKTLAGAMKMTVSYSTLFISYFLNFTENMAISSNIRIIYNGIRVGIWGAVAKKTATFTKTAKKEATWNKEQKNI